MQVKLMIETPILVAGRFGSGLQSKPGTRFEKADSWVSPSPYQARNDDGFIGMITVISTCLPDAGQKKMLCFCSSSLGKSTGHFHKVKLLLFYYLDLSNEHMHCSK